MSTRTSALTRWRGISTCRRSVGVGVGNAGGEPGEGVCQDRGTKADSASAESLEDRDGPSEWGIGWECGSQENHCQCLIKVFEVQESGVCSDGYT